MIAMNMTSPLHVKQGEYVCAVFWDKFNFESSR